jgi:hypothetical protein
VTLDVMPESYAICRLPAGAALPSWPRSKAFSSVTRTAAELSIVCVADDVPDGVRAERGYRLLAVRGPLDFGLVGVVAALSAVLASAAISIFVVSTYDTDFVLVRGADLDRAGGALRAAGHEVVSGA